MDLTATTVCKGPIHTGNNIAQYDLYSLVCAGNCVVCKGGIGDRYCTNCQQRRMIGQYTTQLPVQTKLYRPYCAILLPVCIGPIFMLLSGCTVCTL